MLGCYYLTEVLPGSQGEGTHYASREDARLAFYSGHLDLQAEVLIRDPEQEGGWLKTSVGRLIFNEVLPPELDFRNQLMDSAALNRLVADCYQLLGNQGTSAVLDSIKNMGFHYATRSGITIAINDVEVPAQKKDVMEWADGEIDGLEEQFQMGLITEEERYNRAVAIWTQASDRMTQAITETLPSYGGIYVMAASGAKGNIAQIKQMAGMRGLMSNPRGRIIDLPIKSSFREGLTVLEYFISTHGARKGLTDTALRTADSGYLTRRLIDIAQDVIILKDDCGTTAGFWLESQPGNTLMAPLRDRLVGRIAATPVANPDTGEIIVNSDQEIDEAAATLITEAGIDRVQVRSPLTCGAHRGLCRLCYGRSLATGKPVLLGEAMGIIAAQSIGEPGTQLTMRTFHTGGVAGVDITSGLPRVEELFEARVPKGMAILSEIDGVVEIDDSSGARRARVVNQEEYQEEYPLPSGYTLSVEPGDWVDLGNTLAQPTEPEEQAGDDTLAQAQGVIARVSGRVGVQDEAISVSWVERGPARVPDTSLCPSGCGRRRHRTRWRPTDSRAIQSPGHPAHPGEGSGTALPGSGGPDRLPLPGHHYQRQAH